MALVALAGGAVDITSADETTIVTDAGAETQTAATSALALKAPLLVTQSVTPGATPAINESLGSLATLTPAQAETLSATNVVAGELFVLEVVTSGTTSYTLTFGTGFKSTGTLATGTVDSKTFTVTFIGVGTTLVEIARTAAM